MNIYQMVRKFKREYPKTVAFRTKAHSSVIERHLNPGEEVLYAFCAQKNTSSLMIINSCAVALTNKRILIGQKRLLWGYFFTTITPDMYNDLKVIKNLIWSDIEIDTVKENVYISNIDPKGAIEIETKITDFMMTEKKKYGQKK
ncbi:MAG: PH domain-containing protein [Bacilli bacterium]|nr:PH domain-containing protein [Bacilli bacterium]